MEEEQYANPTLSYRYRLSDSQAADVIRPLVSSIHQQRDYLRRVLNTRADTLMSRWKKRSKEKRRALLKAVNPELEVGPGALVRLAYSNEWMFFNKRTADKRQISLLPWLDADELTINPMALLALLHFRTAHEPPEWAPWDTSQLTMPFTRGLLDVDFSPKCVVMYGPKYGDLVEWEVKAAHRADILGFPRARLTLEAQALLLRFLRGVVDQILDVDGSSPEGEQLRLWESEQPRVEKWTALVSAGAFRRPGELEFWSSYLYPAFSAPPSLNSARLVELARAHREAAADHLAGLQCDPVYMLRFIQIAAAGSAHWTKLSEPRKAALIYQQIRTDIVNYYLWRWAEMECVHIDRLGQQLHIAQGSALPAQFDHALGVLEIVLINGFRRRVGFLQQSMPHVPGFGIHWSVPPNAPPMGDVAFGRSSALDNIATFNADRLKWCLSQLPENPDLQQSAFGPALLFSILDSSPRKEKCRLNSFLHQRLSDISVCHEMLSAVRLSRPQNTNCLLDEHIQSEGWRESVKLILTLLLSEGKTTEPVARALFCDFYKLHRQSNHGQLPRRNTEAWLEARRSMRAPLEKFWDGIRAIVADNFKESGITPQDNPDAFEVLSSFESETHRRAIRAEEEAVAAAVAAAATAMREKRELINATPLGEVFVAEKSHNGTTTTATAALRAAQQRKNKQKTRPEPEVLPSSVHAEEPPVAQPPREPPSFLGKESEAQIIETSKRACDILTRMFRRDNQQTTDWNLFVLAMRGVGFTARNTGGSAVAFQLQRGPNGENNTRKIVFHKPHPDQKIDSVMLHHFSRRLARRFGWGEGCFVVKGERAND